MGSLNSEWKRLRAALEGSVPPPEDEASRRKEARRQEIIAELNALEERLKRMTPEEWEEHERWRNSPEGRAQRAALEAEIKRRQEGRWGA